MTKAATGFDKMKGAALGMGTALIVPMGIGLKAAVDLEQSIANVNASLGGLDSGTLDKLSASFQQVGADSMFSATEVATMADELAKAGFGAEDLLGGMTQSVVELAQATGDGLGPALDGIVQAMSTWKEGIVDSDIAMTDAARAADILTIAANQSKAGIGDINAGMRSLGPVAAMMDIPFEDSAAAIALFTNNGLKGADAGISLARGLQNLADPTTEAADLMNELGIAAFDTEGSFVGFPSLFRQLQTGMSGMSSQAQLTALSTIFGAEAMDVMGLAILNGAEPLEAMIALMGESGAAAEQSALRMDTLGAQFDTLKEGVTTFLGSLVQGLIPGMRLLVDTANVLVDVLMKIPAPIKTIIGAIAGLLATFAAVNIAMKTSAALNGLLGVSTAGMAASLAGMIPIVLAVAAVAGVLYLAWKKNFLGIRDLADKVVGKVTGFIEDMVDGVNDAVDAFMDVWDAADDVTVMFGEFGAVIDKIGSSVNVVSRFLYSLSAALKSINGDNTPAWLVTLALGMDTVADAIDELVQRFQGLRALGLNPVSAALIAIGTTFESLAPLMNDLAGIVSNVSDAFSAFVAGDYAAGFRSLGEAAQTAWNIIRDGATALSGVVVRIASWTVETAQSMYEAVANWVMDTAWPAARGAAGAVAGVIVSIAGWAIDGVLALPGLFGEIAAWVGDTAWPAALGAAGAVGGVIVDIAGWARGTAADVWDFITSWVSSLVSTVSNVADGVSDVMLNILSWARGTAANIWEFVTSWVSSLVSIASAASGSISDVLVNIASWARGEAANIWEFVSSWLDGLVAVASGIAADIASVAVNILSWARGEIADLWGAIKSWVFGGGVAGGGSALGAAATGRGIDIERVLVRIGEFKVANDVGDLISGINTWIDNAVTVTDAEAAAWEPKGRAIGQKVMAAIITGIKNIFSGGGGGGIAGGGSAAGGPIATGGSFGDGIWRYLQPMFEGAWEELKPELDAWAESTKRSIEGWWNSIAPSFLEFDRSYTLAGGGAALGGAAGGGGGMLQGVVDAFIDGGIVLLADLAEWGSGIIADIQEWWDGLWDFDLSLPDFDILGFLPDIGFDVADIPGYDRAKAAVDAFKDLLDFGGDKYGEDGPGGGGAGGIGGGGPAYSAGPTGAQIDRLQEAQGGGRFAGLIAEIQTVATALTNLGTSFTTAQTAVTTFVSTTIGVMGGWAVGLGVMFTTLGTNISTASLSFTTFQTAVVTFVSTTIGVMGGWVTGIGVMFATFGTTFTTASLALTTFQTSIITFVATTIGVLGGWSVGIGVMLTTFGTNITTAATTLATFQASIVAFVATTIGVMGGWSVGIATQVTTAMTTFRTAISSGTSAGKQSVITFVSTTIGVMGGWAGGMRNIVTGAMNAMTSAAAAGASRMTASLAQGAQRAASAVRSALGVIPGIVRSIGAAGASAAYSAGAAISQGFAAGMRSALGAIQASANAMVNAANQAVRARARISSPSKLFAELGEYLGEGFAIGIDHMQREVARSAAALVSIPSGAAIAAPAYAVNSSLSRRQDRAVAAAPSSGSNVTNYYLVVTKEEIDDLFDAATGFKVLTSPAEVAAAQGRI